MKRQLTGEEKRTILKVLKAKKSNLDWIKYQIKYYELILSEGLEQSYIKQRREHEQTLKDFQNELDTHNKIDAEMRKQLKEGVEMKETKTNEKEVK